MQASINDKPKAWVQAGADESGKSQFLPLLRAQHGVWIAQQLDPGNPRYNCGGYLEIHGEVDAAILESALRQALLESEALRVRFIESDEGVRQLVGPVPPEVLRFADVSRHPDPAADAEAEMKSDLSRFVNLNKGELYTHILFKLSPVHYFFYVRYHHILMDGFGQTRYWGRVGEIYSAMATESPCTAASFVSLSDLLKEDEAYRVSASHARDEQYWLDAFKRSAKPARLSGAASLASRNLLRCITRFDLPTIGRVREATERFGHRWSVLMLAATAAYMQRMTGNENVVLGLPVTARMTATVRDTPCMLANELPLRLAVPSNVELKDLLLGVSTQIGRLLVHQRYRGEELHRALNISGGEDKLTGPVANVMSFDHKVRFGECDTTAHYLSSGPVADLSFGFYAASDGSDLTIYFDANPDLYTSEDLRNHQQRFVNFFDAFLSADLELPISRLDLLLPDERERLATFNATDRQYDLTRCLHELIELQAIRTPDAVAIEMTGKSMTYRQLNDASSRLAAHLSRLGLAPGTRVGVFEHRSLELVIDLLAVMKAGAAYVPLDPELPLARLQYQIDDAAIELVLSRSTLRDRLSPSGVQILAVDQLLADLPPAENVAPASASPQSVAYVIYTSGSTGQPKGVEVPHKGVVNRLLWMQEAYGLEPGECVLQKTPMTFDVSVWEFFWPLMTGARLFLADPGAHRDPRYVARIIHEQAVTTLHFVPPMLDLFLAESGLAELKSLRRVICSGEALRPESVRRFFDVFKPEMHATELHNLYGPTEASIDVTAWQCRPEDADGPIPIGRPVANTQIHVLDANGFPSPIGMPGELYIGGVQVACGYVGRPELTAERFLPNPFAAGTMYRTGDLARFRKDGAVEFLGRLDHQIKLRGFRIELGEIESALLAHHLVNQAVVTVWGAAQSESRLVAYVVPGQEGEEARRHLVEELLSTLRAQLPEYMVPSHIVMLPALPLSPNGKIDRNALPRPEVEVAGELVSPSTPSEALLFKAWQQVLGISRFSVDQSFFSLGGDSMLAIRMRVATERQGYSFSIQDLFRFPTIQLLARHLRAVDHACGHRAQDDAFGLLRAEDRALLPDGLDEAYPLSALQGGMLFHAELDTDTAVYRVVTSLHLAARLDHQSLRQAVRETIGRHPALRSSFDLSTYSEPLQLVHSHVDIPIDFEDDLGEESLAAHRAIQDWIARAKFHRFDVAKAPLLRFHVHPRGRNSFQLTVVEHHVVLDGWSDAVMLGEILNRYRALLSGEELWLPQIVSSFRDFVAEEQRALEDDKSRSFWAGLLRGAEPTLLPRKGLQHGEQRVTRQQAFDVPLDGRIAQKLDALARQEGLPLKSLLAVAHVAVLRLVCNATDVVMGVVSNGRLEEPGGDEVIGVFLNTLPVRLDTASCSLLSLARQVFAQEQDSASHRRYPFAQIQRDLDGQLQLDSYVNFMDFHLPWRATTHGADVAILDSIGVAETNVPLAVNFLMDPVHHRLRLWLDCDQSVLDAEFCGRLVGYYQRALAAIAEDPAQDIAEIELLDAAETEAIAHWNDTAVDYDARATVHEQFAAQVGRSPQATALAYRWETLSYSELDARANQLAHHLRHTGVHRGSLVGVSLHRGCELVIALLAIMKAGGAYVPLDPAFPRQRLDFIVGDAGIDCLITDLAGPSDLAAGNLLLIDRDADLIAARPRESVAPDTALDARGDDPVYVIYTSGSTGLPKGTVIRHRNVVNFFAGMNSRIPCTATDSVLAITSVSFDISVLELLWPLTRGAKVVVASENMIGNLTRDELAASRPLNHGVLLPAQQSMWRVAASKLARENGWATFPDGLHEDMRWLDGACDVGAFERAAAAGTSVITPLMLRPLEELKRCVDAYRAAAAFAPEKPDGRVFVAVPSFVLDDSDRARQLGRITFKSYVAAHPELHPLVLGNSTLSGVVSDAELELAVDRYFDRFGLIGSPSQVVDVLHGLARAGVDGVAYDLDFGLTTEQICDGLPGLRRLAWLHSSEAADVEHSFADLCKRHRITLMQSTPSFLAAVASHPAALEALQTANAVLVGGEAFAAGLAERLLTGLPRARVFNMYGPTETTIWSTVHELDRAADIKSSVIPIGRPIANTELLVLDSARRPVPIGVAGELWIGGDGVAGLYLGRPELTEERFPAHPSGNGQIYRTGDRVRWRRNGLLEFLGRVDRQVKILGHRVEPDEVESVLSLHPQVSAVAVVAQVKDSGTAELVAFVSPSSLGDHDAESSHVRRWGEVWDGAYSGTEVRDDDDARDFAGWISSYDNEPIPAAQMREWLRHAVKRIDALRPSSVVDVGVGVGLFLRELAPRVQRYVGLDVSDAALRRAEASLVSRPDVLARCVSLQRADATHIESLAQGCADTVILNSVVQYFPGTEYLERVLCEAARVVGTQGAVFVGDVRDLGLLEAFHAWVQFRRAPALMPAREIAAVAARQLSAEHELCLSAAFFRQLAARIDTLAAPRLEIKRGHAENELTCFRFDVSLLGRDQKDRPPPGTSSSWGDRVNERAEAGVAAALADLDRQLRTGMAALTITDIPNQRLMRPLKLVQLLREADASAVAWDLEKSLWEADDGSAVDPEAVAELAERHGYRIHLLVPLHGGLDRFDAVMSRTV